MATFLNTRKAVAEIEDLIKNAGITLVLISPYLKLSKDFKELLTYRNNKELTTTIIFGKQELKPEEMKFLQNLRLVILKYNEDLHAKCYANEKQMIITSLNLYEFSMANNKEMGVLINKDDPKDKTLYEEAWKEVDYINTTSEKFNFNINEEKKSTKTNLRGHCIRCGTKIKLNPEHPYCFADYKKWKKFEDEKYVEKDGVCHICGKSNSSSLKKPVCRSCYRKNKELFN